MGTTITPRASYFVSCLRTELSKCALNEVNVSSVTQMWLILRFHFNSGHINRVQSEALGFPASCDITPLSSAVRLQEKIPSGHRQWHMLVPGTLQRLKIKFPLWSLGLPTTSTGSSNFGLWLRNQSHITPCLTGIQLRHCTFLPMISLPLFCIPDLMRKEVPQTRQPWENRFF